MYLRKLTQKQLLIEEDQERLNFKAQNLLLSDTRRYE